VVVIDQLAPVVYSKQRVLNWRHNLDAGARPVLLEPGEAREASVAIAIKAAKAIGIRFASVDVIRVGGALKILEINSGVMMEALGKFYPDLVDAAYSAALDRVFGCLCRPGVRRDP
jgi:glutathione synthase/RimK-type ligase-like ATP-grasp enzyme